MKEFYGCWSPQNEELYRSVKALRNIALMGALFATLSLTSLTLASSLLPLSSFISCFLTLTVALPIQNIPYLPSLLFSSSHSDIYFSPRKVCSGFIPLIDLLFKSHSYIRKLLYSLWVPTILDF